jgi:hypothetical protein
MYSLRSIILVADSDVSIHKICQDTSKFATRITEWREQQAKQAAKNFRVLQSIPTYQA